MFAVPDVCGPRDEVACQTQRWLLLGATVEEVPSEGGLRFRPELGHRRVGIALLGAVELGDFREMNFGDANFVIAVLRPLLFLRTNSR